MEKEHPSVFRELLEAAFAVEEPAVNTTLNQRKRKRDSASRTSNSNRLPTRPFFQNNDPVFMQPEIEPPEDFDSTTPDEPPPPQTHSYPDAGLPLHYVSTESEDNAARRDVRPWHPFRSQTDFDLAELFTQHGCTAGFIDDILKLPGALRGSVKRSLRSNYMLRKTIDLMTDGLGHRSWHRRTMDLAWNASHPEPITFYSRDIIKCAQWLLRQPAYRDHTVYAPERVYSNDGRRLYNEMNTGEWWWEQQVGYQCDIVDSMIVDRTSGHCPGW
jgi:hypothetical protein